MTCWAETSLQVSLSLFASNPTGPYSKWKKSCTAWDVKNSVNSLININGLPSAELPWKVCTVPGSIGFGVSFIVLYSAHMLIIDSQLSLRYSDVKCLKFKTLKPIKQPYASEILKPQLTGALCLKQFLSGKKVLLFHSFRSWTVWTFGLKKWCSPRSLSLASSGPRSKQWGFITPTAKKNATSKSKNDSNFHILPSIQEMRKDWDSPKAVCWLNKQIYFSMTFVYASLSGPTAPLDGVTGGDGSSIDGPAKLYRVPSHV